MLTKSPHIFMIGWELPPQNSGGLGVACAGLTDALAATDLQIDFTLPYEFEGQSSALNIIDCSSQQNADLPKKRVPIYDQNGNIINYQYQTTSNHCPPFDAYTGEYNSNFMSEDLDQVKNNYLNQVSKSLHHYQADQLSDPGQIRNYNYQSKPSFLQPVSVMERQVEDYSEKVLAAAAKNAKNIDIVHAHDWMSLAAATKIKTELGKPMIAHIHSTEFDRTLNADFNSYITRTEYEGMRLADKVIAVSYYTKRLLVEKYLIDPYKIEVVHNGIDPYGFRKHQIDAEKFAPSQPVIVFMGRLTMQKGADYFLALASKILAKRPDALFIMAGAGDMYQDLLLRNAHYGLSASVLFTNFLRGKSREALLTRADVFVMPSVSEPFGLVAMEAVQAGTPVVISKNSGVAEVLYDTPAVDFWDINQLAEETLALINNPNYHRDLLTRQYLQLSHITWEKSAQKVEQIYQKLLQA